MRVRIRYETPDQEGEIRRDRNAKFGVPSPEIEIPDAGLYLWQWYEEIASGVIHIRDGNPQLISMREFRDWSEMTGNVIRREELTILRAMDLAYCGAMSSELADHRERAAAKAAMERKSKRG